MLCESWWFADRCKQCNKKDVAANAPKDAATNAAANAPKNAAPNAILLQNEKAYNGILVLLSDSAMCVMRPMERRCVCGLLQLAMLKCFFFKVLKLLSAQVMHRGCSCSVLSALQSSAAALSCLSCSAAAAHSCLCCSAAVAATTAAAAAAPCSVATCLAAYKAVKWLGRTALRTDSLAARAARYPEVGDTVPTVQGVQYHE